MFSRRLMSLTRGACGVFTEHLWDYHFFIDYACVDQDDPSNKLGGIMALPLYVSTCTELLFYDSDTTEYEPRGWTRVERMFAYAFTFPLMSYIGKNFPDKVTD
eukprot:4545763-Amphidinium_carterae.1